MSKQGRGRKRRKGLYPGFADALLSHENNKDISPRVSLRWRSGIFPKYLKWLIERPDVMLALYEDIVTDSKEGKEGEQEVR